MASFFSVLKLFSNCFNTENTEKNENAEKAKLRKRSNSSAFCLLRVYLCARRGGRFPNSPIRQSGACFFFREVFLFVFGAIVNAMPQIVVQEGREFTAPQLAAVRREINRATQKNQHEDRHED